jgi:hypothetical protein
MVFVEPVEISSACRFQLSRSAVWSIFHDRIPISYPMSTSVLLPSHPLFPAAESIYLQVGSM